MRELKKLSLEEALWFGLKSYAYNFELFLALVVLASFVFFMLVGGYALLFSFPHYTPAFLLKNPLSSYVPWSLLSPLYVCMVLCVFVVTEYFFYRLIKLSMSIYEGHTPSFGSLFTRSPHFGQFFLARILFYSKSVVRFMLLIIPGIRYAVLHYFTGYSITHFFAHSIKDDAIISKILVSGSSHDVYPLFLINFMLFLLFLGACMVLNHPIFVLFFGCVYFLIQPLMTLINVYTYSTLMAFYRSH
ncbi:hypothetical protein H0X06_00625 [Candidatus Dependentiae bacterium]|nr:hypothetical protein [Candidatus Dependentiae bacterium]